MWETVVINPTQSTTIPGSVVVPQREVVGECENEGERTAGANWRGRGELWAGQGREFAVGAGLAKDAGGLGA